MNVVNELYTWTDRVVEWGLIALYAWAFVDCVTRKPKAFPAVDKLSKPAWLGILAFSGLIGALILEGNGVGGSGFILSLVAAVIASVYLADVRPAVRDITGGSRW